MGIYYKGFIGLRKAGLALGWIWGDLVGFRVGVF